MAAVGDPFAQQILYDVIEFYLKGVVLERRASRPLAPQTDQAAPSADAASQNPSAAP